METDTNRQERTDVLRRLPPVHRLLAMPELQALQPESSPTVVADSVRRILASARQSLLGSPPREPLSPPSEADLVRQIIADVARQQTPSLQSAVNATGVVLHTGLGRSTLAADAQKALLRVARGHATLEIDVDTGKRGSRLDHVRNLLCELTGAGGAAVVNNGAAAVFLAVAALGAGREVIISRGELVEIGGAFRMPDIVRASGAILVEVGATNRTRLSDYSAAISEKTGLILRCHPSNFAIVGFTEAVPTADLVALAAQHGLPVLDDQGSGALIEPRRMGLSADQASLPESVRAGSTVTTASGDKLLGGPQAGLLLGEKDVIARIMQHPLARAVRVDKFTLAALEATLRLYRDSERAAQSIPTLRYLMRSQEELRHLAVRLRARLRKALPPERFALSLVASQSQVGGGSLPGEHLPTTCVAIRPLGGSVDPVAAHFRRSNPPIFARIHESALLFDPRTLESHDIDAIAAAASLLNDADSCGTMRGS